MEQRVLICDDNGATVTHFPRWVTPEETEPLIAQMETRLLPLMDHDRGFNRFTNKEWISQRLIATISTSPGVSYHYGTAKKRTTCDTTFDDLPWLEDLRQRAEKLCGKELNFVFCNFYRPSTPEHPEDHLGWHSDAEQEMAPGAPIVSVSFGDTRHFAFRRKGETKTLLQTPLMNGDAVIMAGTTQKHYEHCVTKKGAKQCTKGRWNLTFRNFTEATRKKHKIE